jgi:cation diffusion facilitator CzcD-associated flavoprotein CzcO
MCVAIDLIRRYNCQNFVIIEKSGGFAGTWRDNTYPGGCCDSKFDKRAYVRKPTNSYSLESSLQVSQAG